MHPFFRTKTGQLFVGGCGTQVGMFLTCGTLFIVVAFCAICVSANILSLGIFQQVAEPAAVNITPVIQVQPASSDEVDSLLSQVNALLGELEIVETECL
jgi:hypothetical protein